MTPHSDLVFIGVVDRDAAFAIATDPRHRRLATAMHSKRSYVIVADNPMSRAAAVNLGLALLDARDERLDDETAAAIPVTNSGSGDLTEWLFVASGGQ